MPYRPRASRRVALLLAYSALPLLAGDPEQQQVQRAQHQNHAQHQQGGAGASLGGGGGGARRAAAAAQTQQQAQHRNLLQTRQQRHEQRQDEQQDGEGEGELSSPRQPQQDRADDENDDLARRSATAAAAMEMTARPPYAPPHQTPPILLGAADECDAASAAAAITGGHPHHQLHQHRTGEKEWSFADGLASAVRAGRQRGWTWRSTGGGGRGDGNASSATGSSSGSFLTSPPWPPVPAGELMGVGVCPAASSSSSASPLPLHANRSSTSPSDFDADEEVGGGGEKDGREKEKETEPAGAGAEEAKEGGDAAAGADEDEVPADDKAPVVEGGSEGAATDHDASATATATTTAPASTPAPPQPSILSVDYASKSAGALVLDKSAEFKGTSNLLTNDRDRYAIVPCEQRHKYVVVGLSEDLLVKRVALAAYERYSSHVQTFQLLGSSASTRATDADAVLASSAEASAAAGGGGGGGAAGGVWVDLGTYTAEFARQGEQAFDLERPAWARYLQFRFLSFYGDEHYCTLSQIKVHGSTVLQGFHEQWSQQEQEEEEAETAERQAGGNAEVEGGAEPGSAAAVEGGETGESESAAGTSKAADTGGGDEDKVSLSGKLDNSDSVDAAEGGGGGHPAAGSSGDDGSAAATPAATCWCDGIQNEENETIGFESLMLLYGTGGNTNDSCPLSECASVYPHAYYGSHGARSRSNNSGSNRGKALPPKTSSSNAAAGGASGSAAAGRKPAGTTDPRTGPAVTVDDVVESLPLAETEVTAPIVERIQYFIQKAGLDDKLEDIKNRFLASTADSDGVDAVKGGDQGEGEAGDGSKRADSAEETMKAVAPSPSTATAKDDKDTAAADLRQQPKAQAAPEAKDLPASTKSSEAPTACKASTPPPSPKTESSHTGTTATNPSSSSKEKPSPIQETGLVVAKLLERLPSASCLAKLDFDALNQKVKSGGQGAGIHPAGGGAVEPVFKKLTDEIKALQASVAVHDQFTRDAVACYQRVLFDLLLESESARLDYGARLDKLEKRREIFGSFIRQLAALRDWLLPHVLGVLTALWTLTKMVVVKDFSVLVCVAAVVVATVLIASVYHVLERLLLNGHHRRKDASSSLAAPLLSSKSPPGSGLKPPDCSHGGNHHGVAFATDESCEASDYGSLSEESCHDKESGCKIPTSNGRRADHSSYASSSVVKHRRTKVKLLKKTSPRVKK